MSASTRRSGLLAVAVLAAAASFPAAAEAESYSDFDLNQLLEMDVVYGASTYEQSVSDAPSAVTVITAEEIEAYGYATLDDVLNSVPGFYTTYDRNYSYVGIRGFGRPGDYNSRLLVLVDGHRMNDNIYQSGSTGTDSPVDLALVKRVEIIRGPSSSLYGSSAFFGVLNLVTKSAGDYDRGEVAGVASSFDGYGAQLAVAGELEAGLHWLASASAYDVGGQDFYFAEFDDPSTNHGVFSGGDFDRNGRAYGKLESGSWRLATAYGAREKGIPTAAWDSYFNDDETRTFDERAWVDAMWRGPVGERGELSVRGYFDHYGYSGWYRYDYADDGEEPWIVTNRDEATGREVGLETRWTGDVTAAARLVVGTELRWNLERYQNNFDDDPAWLYFERDDPSNEQGLFAQAEWRLHERVHLNVGARHDRYADFESTNPRLALMVEPRRGTILKALYGTAFRAPNAYELFYGDGEWQKGNLDLTPEEMEAVELVWEQELGGRISGIASVFRYDIHDLITQATDPDDGLLVFENVDRIESQGLELALDARLLSRWRGRASYSFQETKDRATDALLTNSPRHLAKLDVLSPLPARRGTIGVELQYMSERASLGGTPSEEHLLTNATLRIPIQAGRTDLTASVLNVFDVDYADPGSGEHLQALLPRDGRSFRTRLIHRW